MKKMSETKSEGKFSFKLTVFIGLAFFTTGIAWSLYNTQVNQKLSEYITGFGLVAISGLLVGLLMAIDNIIGVFVQPVVGSLSDNTRTKYGRRTPFILIGIPLAAITFALIPLDFLFLGGGFIYILVIMFLFGISMAIYRAPAVALMPDFIRPEDRSKANAIINLMGGIGSVMAFSLGYVINLFTNVNFGVLVAFIIAGVIMIIALIIFRWKVDENKAYTYKLLLEIEEKEGRKVEEEKSRIKIIESLKGISKEKDKSMIFMLIAIFLWFITYQGFEALFSIYAGPFDIEHPLGVLNLSKGTATLLFNFVAIPFILSAYPLSLLAKKIGRRNCIKIGLIAMIVSAIIGFLFRTVTITIIILVIFGIGWALVNVNSIVIVWELAPSAEKVGTYTGLYYASSFLAAIFGPGIIGVLRDLLGKESLFLNGAIFLVIALIFMFFVKRGEIELTDEQKLLKQKAIKEL